MRSLWLRLHQVAGLAAGLFLCVMGLTGALMSFEEEIMAAASPGTVTLAPPSTGAKLSPDALLGRLRAARPDLVPGPVEIDGRPDHATRIRVTAQGGGRETRQDLYVDPYDGRVLGPARGAEAFATIRKIHRWLLLPGDGNGYGRQVTGAAAIALAFLALTGLYLRWPLRPSRWRSWFKLDLARRGRPLLWSLHATIGTWLLPVYLVSALTGLWWSYPAYKDAVSWLLVGPAPERPAGGRARERTGRPEASALDPAWTAFLTETSGHFAKALIDTRGDEIRIRALPPEARHPGARDEYRFEARTGALRARELQADKTLGQAMAASWLEVHRGRFFGTVPSLLTALAAALLPLFAVTGLLLYLGRRRFRVPSDAQVARRPLGAPGQARS